MVIRYFTEHGFPRVFCTKVFEQAVRLNRWMVMLNWMHRL